MSITHSPGPWGAPTHSGNGRFEVATDRRIAVVDRYDDARLVQAAPNMLKALQMVQAWWVEQGMSQNDGAPACLFEVSRVLDEVGQPWK